ncbi:N-acetyltransferase 8 [Hippopotamus amphibius kiboko]|uniref:N-acetyltransferase 8 n=1 Tax=Hippopotamus amphibius kiboko TaxID=575201 RepID=UPI002599C3F9|nr:N-acetyltransferase 8 [Hippopotamus amphibius kiboko]
MPSSLLDFESQTQKSSMAPYQIHEYQENDREGVMGLFSKAMTEHIPTTFLHLLKLPQTLVLLFGGPLAVFLVSGSWVLAFLASLALLAALTFLAKYLWTQFEVMYLHTDMSDITKSYFSESGSCFWVAESERQVVGMVGGLPVKPTLQKKQLQLLHLCVALEHRGQGIAKALVRTVLKFARDQGYSEVVLNTSILQYSALALYQRLGFQNTSQFFYSISYKLLALPFIQFTYRLPSAQVPQALEQGGSL